MAALESFHAAFGIIAASLRRFVSHFSPALSRRIWLLASASRILPELLSHLAHLSAAIGTLLIHVLGFAPGLRKVVAFLLRKVMDSNHQSPFRLARIRAAFTQGGMSPSFSANLPCPGYSAGFACILQNGRSSAPAVLASCCPACGASAAAGLAAGALGATFNTSSEMRLVSWK